MATQVHSSFLYSFNYSVHQFLLFFQLFCQPSLTLQFSILPHTPVSLLSNFPLHSLFISLSISTPVHSSILSSFNYSVHQFLLFFSTFLTAFFDFTVLYPSSHSISLLHSIFLSFFQYFPSSLSLYHIIHSHSC